MNAVRRGASQSFQGPERVIGQPDSTKNAVDDRTNQIRDQNLLIRS